MNDMQENAHMIFGSINFFTYIIRIIHILCSYIPTDTQYKKTLVYKINKIIKRILSDCSIFTKDCCLFFRKKIKRDICTSVD